MIVYYLAVGVANLLLCVPYALQLFVLRRCIATFVFFSPRYRNVIYTNLKIVFPEKSLAEHHSIAKNSIDTFARVIADSLRLGYLDQEWFLNHVEFPDKALCQKVVQGAQPKGCMFVGGHVGSFEFIAPTIVAHTGFQGKVIARSFKNERLDEWYNSKRSMFGAKVIARQGAVKRMIHTLRNGEFVGLLFDQNVTRNLGVFVDFFGMPAATSKALGFTCVRLEVPILAFNMEYLGNDRYRLHCRQVPVEAVIENERLSFDEKVIETTKAATRIVEEYVCASPESWFWMHRRWKTRPDPQEPSPYG